MAATEGALEVLEPLGVSPELAWALATSASNAMLREVYDVAVENGRRALALAGELGLEDVRSDALNTLAVVACWTGDGWDELLREALDIALRSGHHTQAARAYTNLVDLLVDHVRYREAERFYRDGAEFCLEHDLATWGLCLDGGHATILLNAGSWDDLERLADGPLAGDRASPINRITFLVPLGLARARRGLPGGSAMLDEASTSATTLAEPEWIVLTSAARAEAHWLAGEVGAAVRILDEGAEVAAGCASKRPLAALTRWRVTRCTGPEAVDLPMPYAAELACPPRAAAEAWDAVGRPYDAAMALLGSDDEQDLRVALDRFEALGCDPAASMTRRKLRASGGSRHPSRRATGHPGAPARAHRP